MMIIISFRTLFPFAAIIAAKSCKHNPISKHNIKLWKLTSKSFSFTKVFVLRFKKTPTFCFTDIYINCILFTNCNMSIYLKLISNNNIWYNSNIICEHEHNYFSKISMHLNTCCYLCVTVFVSRNVRIKYLYNKTPVTKQYWMTPCIVFWSRCET